MRIEQGMNVIAAAGVAFTGTLLVTIIGHVATRPFHRDHGPQELLIDFSVGAVVIGSAYACHKLMQVMRAERVR